MNSEHDDAQIVQLISSHQRSLFGYLLGLLGARELAEDALQETNLVLWEKRREYQPNTKFFAWACQIAYFKAGNLRTKWRRKIPAFSEVFMQEVSPDLAAAVESPNHMESLLKDCLDSLDENDVDLLDQRYADEATVNSIATRLNQSVRSVYRDLERIHQWLFRCITEKTRDDGAAT